MLIPKRTYLLALLAALLFTSFFLVFAKVNPFYSPPTSTSVIEKTSNKSDDLLNSDKPILPALDPSFPAPAKKLHQLLSEAQLDDGELTKKMQEVDADLEIVNSNMPAIALDKEHADSMASSDSAELEQRISRMRQHMEDRALLE